MKKGELSSDPKDTPLGTLVPYYMTNIDPKIRKRKRPQNTGVTTILLNLETLKVSVFRLRDMIRSTSIHIRIFLKSMCDGPVKNTD